MQAVRNIGIRFAALLAIGGLWALPAAAQSDDAMEQFRLVAATSAAKLNAKSESKDRGVVVYVMRGWLDVFSTGMDDLAAKMKARGINAIAMSHSDHLSVAAEIIARHKKGIKERPVLIGHSLGANATISMSAELGKGGVHVPLIIMFDPTVENLNVPSNVGRAVNFFQSNNGWGVKVGRAAGFKGKLENVDLYKEELGHTGIDKSPRLHLQSISFVQSLRGVRDPAEEPAPRPRPKIETAGEPKATPALLSSEPKAETKNESMTAAPSAPAVPVASPASSEAKAASTEPKPAAEKPAETKSSSDGKPDGLFSDVKRPTL